MVTFLERAAHAVDNMLSLYYDYLQFKVFPVFDLRAEFGF